MSEKYWAPHVTVACVVEQQGRFLMVEERIENGQIAFNQPAGHLDPKEDILSAAIRECKEESAYQFDPHALVGIYHWTGPNKQSEFMRFCLCGTANEIRPRPALDTDIIATHWMSFEEIQSNRNRLRSQIVLRCVKDYCAGQRYPLTVLKQNDQ